MCKFFHTLFTKKENMKKIAILIIIFLGLIAGTGFYPADANAKTKGKHAKVTKKHLKAKKHKNGKKQTIDESLNLLQNYLPEYYNLTLLASEGQFANNMDLPSEFDQNSIFTDPILRKELIENINDWLGTRYSHGGHSKAGVDCSNFTSAMVERTLGIQFPRSPGAQAALFNKIDDLSEMQFGDLIFFTGRNKKAKRIGHVGFYLGDGLFAHSSSGRGVIYTHINQGYYSERFRFGGRFINSSWAGILKPTNHTN